MVRAKIIVVVQRSLTNYSSSKSNSPFIKVKIPYFEYYSSFAQGKLYHREGILLTCNGISFEQNREQTLYPNHSFVYKIRKRSFGGPC